MRSKKISLPCRPVLVLHGQLSLTLHDNLDYRYFLNWEIFIERRVQVSFVKDNTLLILANHIDLSCGGSRGPRGTGSLQASEAKICTTRLKRKCDNPNYELIGTKLSFSSTATLFNYCSVNTGSSINNWQKNLRFLHDSLIQVKCLIFAEYVIMLLKH